MMMAQTAAARHGMSTNRYELGIRCHPPARADLGCAVWLLIANLFASVSMRRVNVSTRICAARGASLISVRPSRVSVPVSAMRHVVGSQ